MDFITMLLDIIIIIIIIVIVTHLCAQSILKDGSEVIPEKDVWVVYVGGGIIGLAAITAVVQTYCE
jgi:hypothetical protein